MELSIFLAQLLGVFLLITAADLLLHKRELEAALKDLASSHGLLATSGPTSILIGLAIVIAHPGYAMNWHGLITLVGYFFIFRGVMMRFASPSYLQKRLVPFIQRNYWVLFLIFFVVGAYLTYVGFTTQANVY